MYIAFLEPLFRQWLFMYAENVIKIDNVNVIY